MIQAVSFYQSTFGQDHCKLLKMYSDFFNNPSYDDIVKAEVALIGGHQSRLNDIKGQRIYAQLAIRKLESAHLWSNQYQTFKDVYSDVQNTLSGISYIGGLTIYDVSLRIATVCNVLPTSVYLSAGAFEGAVSLLGKAKVQHILQVSAFSKFPAITSMTAWEIEDFLCIFKKNLSTKGIIKSKSYPKYRSNNCCGLHRNMLAYQIFVLHKVSITSNIIP